MQEWILGVQGKTTEKLSWFKKTGTASFDVTLQGFAPRNWAVTRESMRWKENNKFVDVQVMLLRNSGQPRLPCHVRLTNRDRLAVSPKKMERTILRTTCRLLGQQL